MQNLINRGKTRSLWLWVVGGAAAIALMIFAGVRLSAGPTSAQSEGETARAFIGDLTSSITATGHLRAHQDVSLTLQTTGVVKEIYVKVGDKVTAGAMLVKLDDTDAQRNIQAARNALDEARLKVDSAQVIYTSTAGWKPNDKQVAAAVAAADNAAAAVQAAQANYDKVAWRPDVSSTQQSLALQQATNNYTQAKANLEYLLTNRPDLATPKINLDLAKLAVNDAQFTLDSAQSTLNKMMLVAPFDGTITAVHTAVGETTSGPVIEMIKADKLEAVLDVDEADMGSLDVSQPALVTLDTWPDTTINGQVILIAPKASSGITSDVVNYEVTLSLDRTSLPIRAGMTVNANITTFSLKNVLLVPSKAIAQENGKFYVNIVTDQGFRRIEVTVGARNNQYTQILSGLKVGDVVQTNNLGAPGRSPGGGLTNSGG